MTKKNFIIRDPDNLNLHFYERYDDSFLLKKAETLWIVAQNQEKFKDFVEQNGGNNSGIDQSFIDAIRAEIHFTELHQFEAFFALLIALFQDLPHWLYLTTYRTEEIKKNVQAFLNWSVKGLTNGQCKTRAEFLDLAIYAGCTSNDEQQKVNWQQNLDNIEWLVGRMAKKYIDGTEYNAYKHGLRIMAGYAYFRLYSEENPSSGIHWASNDSLMFLELKDKGEGGLTVYETTKQFNPEESMNHLLFMSTLLETVKSVRLSILKGEQDVKLNTFFKMDKDGLAQLGHARSWSAAV